MLPGQAVTDQPAEASPEHLRAAEAAAMVPMPLSAGVLEEQAVAVMVATTA